MQREFQVPPPAHEKRKNGTYKLAEEILQIQGLKQGIAIFTRPSTSLILLLM